MGDREVSGRATYDLAAMTDRDLLKAYDLQVQRAENAYTKGDTNRYKVHVKFYQTFLNEYFRRIDLQLSDFGDNELDRREPA
jgi:hypothetical protein